MLATPAFRRLANRFGKRSAPAAAPKLHVQEFRSKAEFHQFYSDQGSAIHQAFLEECALCKQQKPFKVEGFCYVCGKRAAFDVDFSFAREISGHVVPAWRESTVCPKCKLSNRLRAAVQMVEEVAQLKAGDELYLTEQASQLYKVMHQRHRHILGSEYLGDKIARGQRDQKGIRNEDVTRLTFSSGQFAAVMCFEVLEHVPDYVAGLSELIRVLKPDGKLVMTVPFNAHIQDHSVRAKLKDDGAIEHLLEPEYHIDPLNPQGCLCFRHFGWAMLDDLRRAGCDDAYVARYASRELGYLGPDPLMFIGIKA